MANNKLSITILEKYQTLLDNVLKRSSHTECLMPFTNSLKRPFEQNINTGGSKDSALLFGTFCIQVPYELIYAVGGQPLRLCMGGTETANLVDNQLPKLACRLIKSLTGYIKLETPFFKQIKYFVLPTTCDWKVKHFERLTPNNNKWVMELPHSKDNELSQKRWFTEIVNFKEWLEKQSGIKIRKKNLLESVLVIQKAQKEYGKFINLRRSGIVSGCEALLVANSYFYLHVAEWTDALENLNRAVIQETKSNQDGLQNNKPRILLAGSPVIFPNFKLPMVLEDAGCTIVADELCSSERIFSDVVSVDDKTENGLLKAIADRYLLPCTCPTFNGNQTRLKRLQKLICENRIDGVVYYVLSGCHPYDIESFDIENVIKKQGIPFIKIETDYYDEDAGQLKTRIEAFAEMLENNVN